jgi:hypothetical protein
MIITDLRRIFLKLAGNRALQHFLFWTTSYVFLVNFFSTGNRLRIGELDIPVGQSYRDPLLKYLQQRSQQGEG